MTFCVGRTGFWRYLVTLVSVDQVLALASAIWCYLVLLSVTVAWPSCMSVCQQETSSLPEVLEYRELWHWFSSGHRQVPERSCYRLLLGSHVQRAPGRSLWAIVVGLTCALRCVLTLVRSTLSQQDLGTETCGPGSAPGADGNRKGVSALLSFCFNFIFIFEGPEMEPCNQHSSFHLVYCTTKRLASKYTSLMVFL